MIAWDALDPEEEDAHPEGERREEEREEQRGPREGQQREKGQLSQTGEDEQKESEQEKQKEDEQPSGMAASERLRAKDDDETDWRAVPTGSTSNSNLTRSNTSNARLRIPNHLGAVT